MNNKCKVCDDTEVIVKVRYDGIWIETPCTECDPFEDDYVSEDEDD